MRIMLITKCLLFLYMSTYIGKSIAQEEPTCNSGFDNVYKMIEKYLLLEKEVFALREQISVQQKSIEVLKHGQKASGSMFTRWGRTVCPGNGTNLLYWGYMAGSDYGHTGTGSNYLCLPSEPRWDYYDTSKESVGKITGVEYQFWHHKDDGAKMFLGDNMYNHNAHCAVCHVSRGNTVMIPGRNVCYDGWTMEYSGYLVSGYYGHSSATEYVCLDRRPEKVPNGNKDDDDSLLYFVEAVCGKSLTCPPYVNGRELSCVVCSL
ncbi:hypothetical protein ACF0H5_019748 [Mactra antiquata]